jgi:hypothetical protein
VSFVEDVGKDYQVEIAQRKPIVLGRILRNLTPSREE